MEPSTTIASGGVVAPIGGVKGREKLGCPPFPCIPPPLMVPDLVGDWSGSNYWGNCSRLGLWVFLDPADPKP